LNFLRLIMDKYKTNFQIKNKTFCFILLSVITFNFFISKVNTFNVVYNYCINIENYIFNISLRLRITFNKLRKFIQLSVKTILYFFPIKTILFTFFSLLLKKKQGSEGLCESMCERVKLNHKHYFSIYIYLF